MDKMTDREVLQELAARPIGSLELEAEANRLAHCPNGKPSPELAETIHRTRKIWLPQGKRSAVEANRKAARLAAEAQIDLEDAVAAAGGNRGGCRQ